jgi:hypothetical protein
MNTAMLTDIKKIQIVRQSPVASTVNIAKLSVPQLVMKIDDKSITYLSSKSLVRVTGVTKHDDICHTADC